MSLDFTPLEAININFLNSAVVKLTKHLSIVVQNGLESLSFKIKN